MPSQKTKCSLSSDDQTLSVPLVDEKALSDGNEPDEPEDIDIDFMTSKLRYHSTESIYDDLKSDKQHDEEEIVGAVSVAVTSNQRKTFQKKRVAKVKSTPAFLNQISEERESDLDDSPRASPRVRRSSRRPLNVIQKTRRPSPASSTGGRRSSSHSSSSEDDGDLDKKMRRLSTERCRRSPKRRSDDEGDGDDGDGTSQGPHGVVRKKMMSEKPQQSGSNKETSSESGNNSNEQGKTAQHGFQSKLLQDKLVNVFIKIEDQNTNSTATDCTATDCAVTYTPIDVSKKSLDFSNNSESLPCSKTLTGKQGLKIRFVVGGECTDSLEDIVKHVPDPDNDIKCSVSSNLSENNVEKRCESIHTDTKLESSKSENVLVDPLNFSMPFEYGPLNSKNKTNGFATTSRHEVECNQPNLKSNEKTVENEIEKGNQQNEKCIVGGGDSHVNNVDIGIKVCESGSDPLGNDARTRENAHIGMTRDEVVNGIMEVFKERSLTNETLENISDKENMDFTAQQTCSNVDNRRLPDSDIEEIEMYIKNKETALELQSVAVRTIYTNPKVSRVTSNCCQII